MRFDQARRAIIKARSTSLISQAGGDQGENSENDGRELHLDSVPEGIGLMSRKAWREQRAFNFWSIVLREKQMSYIPICPKSLLPHVPSGMLIGM